MGTDKQTDGLPPGTYQICIVGTDLVEAVFYSRGSDGEGQREVRTPLINAKYANVETSGLKFTVDGKTKKFDIQVERAK